MRPLEHLILTGETFVTHWDAALRHTSPAPCEGAQSRYNWWERAFLEFIEPPYRVRLNSPAKRMPRCRRPIEVTMRSFRSTHREFTKRAQESSSLDLKRIRMRSPVTPLMYCSLGFS